MLEPRFKSSFILNNYINDNYQKCSGVRICNWRKWWQLRKKEERTQIKILPVVDPVGEPPIVHLPGQFTASNWVLTAKMHSSTFVLKLALNQKVAMPGRLSILCLCSPTTPRPVVPSQYEGIKDQSSCLKVNVVMCACDDIHALELPVGSGWTSAAPTWVSTLPLLSCFPYKFPLSSTPSASHLYRNLFLRFNF